MNAYEVWLQARLTKVREERDALQAEVDKEERANEHGRKLFKLRAQHDADEKLILALTDQLTKQAAVIESLRKDLVKMLPKSSNTMSAMRQRDITNFVLSRLDALNEGRSE